MPSVVVWNPELIAAAPPTIELFVTRGELDVGRGSEAFLADVLRDARVEGAHVVRWTVERYRAHYFTSYPWPDQAWQDRWPFAWRFQIEVSTSPAFRGDSLDGKYFSEAVDETERAEPDEVRCLVLADFDDRTSADAARELVAPAAGIGRAMGRFAQLQIDLGPRTTEFYANGATEAEAVMRACTDLGGRVHHFDSSARKLELESRP